MKELLEKNQTVTIQGKEYKLREMSLAEKIKILDVVGDFIKDITKHAFFKKVEGSSTPKFFLDDEIGLDALNIDKIILSSVQALPEILKLSVPDFTDWQNLPESQSREILKDVLEINDFKGFIANFISLATAIIR